MLQTLGIPLKVKWDSIKKAANVKHMGLNLKEMHTFSFDLW